MQAYFGLRSYERLESGNKMNKQNLKSDREDYKKSYGEYFGLRLYEKLESGNQTNRQKLFGPMVGDYFMEEMKKDRYKVIQDKYKK